MTDCKGNSVLLATDEPNFSLGFVQGYTNINCLVTHSGSNFVNCSGVFDVIHFQWPEEFSGWKAPKREQVKRISDKLDFWERRAKIIFTVNNLYPHRLKDDENAFQLYNVFATKADLITHYSHASERAFKARYEISKTRKHIVHQPPNYLPTRERQRARGSNRARYGFNDDEFVVLTIGRLRSVAELGFLRKAFSAANVPKKRLLVGGAVTVPQLEKALGVEFGKWIVWSMRNNVVHQKVFLPEERLSELMDTCDICVVPRLEGLSSAAPLLAMTFGKPIVAPNANAYPEYLAGTNNFLYREGDHLDLARNLEVASASNLVILGQDNERVASGWLWADTCSACISAVGLAEGPNSGAER